VSGACCLHTTPMCWDGGRGQLRAVGWCIDPTPYNTAVPAIYFEANTHLLSPNVHPTQSMELFTFTYGALVTQVTFVLLHAPKPITNNQHPTTQYPTSQYPTT